VFCFTFDPNDYQIPIFCCIAVRIVALTNTTGNMTVVDGTMFETAASTAVVVGEIVETTAAFITADVKLIQTVEQRQ